MNLRHQVKRIGILTPPVPWDRPVIDDRGGQEVVIMLHGLWRSVRAMQPMAKHLSAEGFTTVNVPYASFRQDLDELVQYVKKEVQPYLAEGKTVHFVTHSLGGVVLKRLLELSDIRDLEKIGRVVMLAPPHKGSEIIDWLGSSPLGRIKGVLGPAGEFLTSERMASQSTDFCGEVEAAVIMGEKSTLPFFRKLLDASNDGIVSVEKGRLFGIKEFKVVDADHTFISSELSVMELVRKFLSHGTMESVGSND